MKMIETNRLILRECEESDAQALYEIKHDELVLKHSPTFLVFLSDVEVTVDEVAATIKRRKRMETALKALAEDELFLPFSVHLYAICLKGTGVIVGAIEVTFEVNTAVMGWFMNSKYTKQGYASEAASAISDELLSEYKLKYVDAQVALDNPASRRTALKAGFTLVEQRCSKYNGEDFEHYYFQKMSTSLEECT